MPANFTVAEFFNGIGTKRTCQLIRSVVAIGGKADVYG